MTTPLISVSFPPGINTRPFRVGTNRLNTALNGSAGAIGDPWRTPAGPGKGVGPARVKAALPGRVKRGRL